MSSTVLTFVFWKFAAKLCLAGEVLRAVLSSFFISGHLGCGEESDIYLEVDSSTLSHISLDSCFIRSRLVWTVCFIRTY